MKYLLKMWFNTFVLVVFVTLIPMLMLVIVSGHTGPKTEAYWDLVVFVPVLVFIVTLPFALVWQTVQFFRGKRPAPWDMD